MLGTSSQVPTRHRNHNGYLLRWDGEGLLFNPGEGSQRQLLLAGASASAVTRLCLTHFPGDHRLGVPGVVQRLSVDGCDTRCGADFRARGQQFFAWGRSTPQSKNGRGLKLTGTETVFCVTGDGRGYDVRPDVTQTFDLDGPRLVALAASLGMTAGVPETPTAPPVDARPLRLVEKQRAGASLAVLNHVPSVSAVKRFMDATRSLGLQGLPRRRRAQRGRLPGGC